MGKVINFDNSRNKKAIHGEKVGTVHVSVYKDATNGLPFFFIESDNEDVSQVSDVIEDFLYYF